MLTPRKGTDHSYRDNQKTMEKEDDIIATLKCNWCC